MREANLQKLLQPKSVAMVGATPRQGTAANRVLGNLQRFGFTGRIYAVNAKYEEVLGLKCYPSIAALPEIPDAVFIALAAEHAVGVLEEAAAAGVKGVICNANGFAGGDAEGEERQRKLSKIANDAGMALCGPNNMGFVNVNDRTCLWTPRQLPPLDPGSIAVITQSGSLSLILTEHERRLGFAYVITAGNEAVCTAADYLQAVIRDSRVRVVTMFLEAIRDPELFAKAAVDAAERGIRIVVLKVGRSARGSAVISGHTGAVTGEDNIYDAFFRRYGIIRVNDIDELVEASVLLQHHNEPPKKRSVIAITCSGGEAGIIADLGTAAKLDFSEFAPQTLQGVKHALPVFAQPRNPFDIWGLGFNIERFKPMLTALLADPHAGVLACSIDAPYGGGVDAVTSRQIAEACVEGLPTTDKKIIFYNNAAGRLNPDVQKALDQGGIPYLSGMRAGLGVIGHWLNLETPVAKVDTTPQRKGLPDPNTIPDTAKVKLLQEAGVTMADCLPVASVAEALSAARKLGYPVVMKGTAPDLPHKTEYNLVRLNVKDDKSAEAAFHELDAILKKNSRAGTLANIVVQPMLPPGIQLLLGLRNDTAFGSIIVVGLGGTYVEVSSDVSLRVGPVDHATALKMLGETRAGTLLAGTRGQGAYDIDAAARAIVALSQFGAETRSQFASIEINPLIVLPKGQGASGVDVVIESFGQDAPAHRAAVA